MPKIYCKHLLLLQRTDIDGYCRKYMDYITCPPLCPFQEHGDPLDATILMADGYNPFCEHIILEPEIVCSKKFEIEPKCRSCPLGEKIPSLLAEMEEELEKEKNY